MMLKQNIKSDMEIISMIEQNDDAGWKNLYDKYALTMYVGVLWVVDDEIFAKRQAKGVEKGVKRFCSDINHTRNLIIQKKKIEKAKNSQEDLWHLTVQNEEGMVFKVLN